MTTIRSLYATALLSVALNAFGWGQKGHDVTAFVAEQHLTAATRTAIDSIFQGRSIVYWANWLDNASHTKPYAYTKTWHYKNIDDGVRYEEAQANPAGDAVTAIKQQIEILSDSAEPLSSKELALKILVHIVGDLHQPMHMGHATDLGGNRIKLKFFGRDTNIHSIWDSSIMESGHKWSFTEWQQQIDRQPESVQDALIVGTVDDWARQTLAETSRIYRQMPEGCNVAFSEVAEWTPLIESQLLKGGLRLAHVLNTIFDNQYSTTHTIPYNIVN